MIFKKPMRPCALNESSLNIGRVNGSYLRKHFKFLNLCLFNNLLVCSIFLFAKGFFGC